MEEIYVVSSRQEADALAHPLTVQILAAFDRPQTAAEVARALGIHRNVAGYHVRKLRDAGFLNIVGRAGRRIYLQRRARIIKIPYALTSFSSPADLVRGYLQELIDRVAKEADKLGREEVAQDDYMVIGDLDGGALPERSSRILVGNLRMDADSVRLLNELKRRITTDAASDFSDGGNDAETRVCRVALIALPPC